VALGLPKAFNNLYQAVGNWQRKKVRMTGTQLHHEEAFGRTGFNDANRLWRWSAGHGSPIPFSWH
jgi:hypothetical protein